MQEILESNLNLKIEFLLIWLAQISAWIKIHGEKLII